MQKIIEVASYKLKEYMQIILSEYFEFMHEDDIKFVENIKDYKSLIVAEDTGTISLFVRGRKIYIPSNLPEVFDDLKKHENWNSKPDNKLTVSTDSNLDFNNFYNYIIQTGASPLDYVLIILLHEAMHLCGFSGGTGLREGITELKTRELAIKYGLLTSGCAYPKEVEIANLLQSWLGENWLLAQSFNYSYECTQLVSNMHAEPKYGLVFRTVEDMMHNFSFSYYSKRFPGVKGIAKKIKAYEMIDYSFVKKRIEEVRILSK